MKLLPILLPFLVLLSYTHVAAAQEPDTLARQENEAVIVAWLRQHAIPIQHVEAGGGFADLQPLKQT